MVTTGYKPSGGKTLGIVAAIILSHVAVNMLSVRKLRTLVLTAICLNSVFVVAVAIAAVAGAKKHATSQFVFSNYFDGTAATETDVGWGTRASPAYVVITGVMFSQSALLGFDASAHLCEETKKAVNTAPRCLLTSVGASFCVGFLVLICLLFSIQDFDKVRSSDLPVLEILVTSCGHGGGLVLMTIICLCAWFNGLFSMVSASRLVCTVHGQGSLTRY